MYFIQEVDKPKFFQKLFSIINIKQNQLLLPVTGETISLAKEQKLARKLIRFFEQAHGKKVVISSTIKQYSNLVNYLQEANLQIMDGKWLFRMLAIESLAFLLQTQNKKWEECQVTILANDASEVVLYTIRELAKKVKSISIVTNHREKYEKLEEQISEEVGMLLTISNHKRKALAKAQYIINFDFPEELINRYQLAEEAIILNLPGKLNISKKRFNGIVIHDYDIEITQKEEFDDHEKLFRQTECYEAEFYQNQPIAQVKEKIKKDGVKIIELYTLKGKWTS